MASLSTTFPFPRQRTWWSWRGTSSSSSGNSNSPEPAVTRTTIADLLGALLVGALIGLPFWALGVTPFLVDSTVPVAVRALDGAYSAITIALVVATALLAVGPGKRNPGYYLLAFSMFVLFVIDTGAILHDMGVEQAGWVTSYVFPVAFIAYAQPVVLHPEVRRLTDRPELQNQCSRDVVSQSRLQLCSSCPFFFIEVRAEHDLEIVLTSVGSAIVALLVLARMTDLVRANERSVSLNGSSCHS